VRHHQLESRSERQPEPFHRRRPHACARQIEAVGLSEPVDELHLIRAKCGHRFLSRAPRRRHEHLRRLELSFDGRLLRFDELPADPVVAERALAVQAATDRVGNAFIQHRKIRPCGHVEMLDALRDRPPIGLRVPVELVIAQ
jgi:hypothetical protein